MTRFISMAPGPRLWAIMALAAALRLVWIAIFPVEPISDANAYDVFARVLSEHGVFGFSPDQPGAYWAVGAPAIYAAGYWLFGPNYWVVEAINFLTSMATVWLLHHVAREYFGGLAAAIAALVFAIWPFAIQFTTVLSSELFFMCFSLASLAAWEKARKGGLLWLALAGACFAATTYVRPIALLMPIVMVMAEIARNDRSMIRAAGTAVGVFVVMALLIAPWTNRNQQVFGETVIISTNFGANFWMGNHPGTKGVYKSLPDYVHGLPEPERSRILLRESIEYIKAEPAAFVTRTLWKAWRLHDRETIGVRWNERAMRRMIGDAGVDTAKIVSTGYWFAMFFGALAGAAILIARGPALAGLFSPPVLIWGYLTGVHAVIVVADRYHMPAIPVIAMLFAFAAATLLTRYASVTKAEETA